MGCHITLLPLAVCAGDADRQHRTGRKSARPPELHTLLMLLAAHFLHHLLLLLPAAPMLDALAAGLRECADKPLVGPKLQLDGFLNNMLRSRISRRVLAEQHINLANKRCLLL